MAVVVEGMNELREALRRLPDDLRTNAGVIVMDAANATVADIVPVYQQHRTNRKRANAWAHLADAVVVREASTSSEARVRVVNKAPHAHLFEFGTRFAEAHPTLVPAAVRHRRTMVSRLIDMVKAEGLEVSGNAE